jgi:hypothetical protein
MSKKKTHNDRRSDVALHALVAFMHKDKRDDKAYSTREDITDLISNLGHLSDKLGIDFKDTVRMALDHWEAERKASS